MVGVNRLIAAHAHVFYRTELELPTPMDFAAPTYQQALRRSSLNVLYHCHLSWKDATSV